MITKGEKEADVASWINDHIYIPIIGGVVLLALIVLVICCCCRARKRRRNYYVYKRLEYDVALAEQLDQEREQRQQEVRDSAFLKCQFYLRSHPNYSNITQLLDLGSRIDKHWFRVRDNKTQTDRMLTILPYNPKMVLPFSRAICKTLKDLFCMLQHPYIFPLTDFDFALEQKYVVIIQPISIRGSLKDYIYQARFQDSWFNKYSQKRRGLTLPQLQQFGRQILEALLYMEEKGFPPHGNIHSGNIMIHDGACRLAGYENSFLGNTSRLLPLMKKKLKDANAEAIDVLSFGHLLFEMTFGFELSTVHPGPQHLVQASSPAIVEVLNFIFENPNEKYPSIKEIINCPFFTHTQLLELQRYNPASIVMTQAMKNALKSVRRGKPMSRKKKSRSSPKSTASIDGLANNSAPSAPTTSTAGGGSSGPPPPPPIAPPPPPPSGPRSGPAAPPPPPPAPVPVPSQSAPSTSSGRGALLSSIRHGARLKKAVTNDRSAPKV